MDRVVLPCALQLCVDDIGWFCGKNELDVGRPSRSGMPRDHVAEDYAALNALGKAIGMKILAPMTVGEWDKDNILRGEIGMTYEPHSWDRKSTIDMKLAESCFAELERSEYIEPAMHGVLHGNYAPDGSQITEMELFGYPEGDLRRLATLPTSELERHFELYFKIYNAWGFTKKIRAFVAPDGIPAHLTADELYPLAEVLSKYGINYWTSRWKRTVSYSQSFGDVFYLEKNVKYGIPWDTVDCDAKKLWNFADENDEVKGDVLGAHWPNFLKPDYIDNLDCVAGWIDYFKRQSEIFGVMLSRDIAFSASQHLYRKFSKLTIENGQLVIDVSEAIKNGCDFTSGELYVSIKKESLPKEISGGILELYETHEGFVTYRIKHFGDVVKLRLSC